MTNTGIIIVSLRIEVDKYFFGVHFHLRGQWIIKCYSKGFLEVSIFGSLTNWALYSLSVYMCILLLYIVFVEITLNNPNFIYKILIQYFFSFQQDYGIKYFYFQIYRFSCFCRSRIYLRNHQDFSVTRKGL